MPEVTEKKDRPRGADGTVLMLERAQDLISVVVGCSMRAGGNPTMR
jgi:hypothetical protein